MIDLYLKFADKAEAEKVLLPMFGVDTDAGARVLGQGSHDWALDNVGVLQRTTGRMLYDAETGMEFPEMEPIPGWHVNIRLMHNKCPQELDGYLVYPAQPKQVWA